MLTCSNFFWPTEKRERRSSSAYPGFSLPAEIPEALHLE